jgi:glycosyltransferase involved in cell wall biosynthesis
MKYSIIIPYRNREAHLQVLLPTLLNKFSGEEFEIIISEQNDDDNFRIACVQNVAYNYAKGEILIFHQVDYVPSDNVSYEVHDVPVLPAHRGIFLNEDNESLRDINDIPAGYRMWSDEIDPNFYGGVICMTRTHFETINGFNPLYRGWGTRTKIYVKDLNGQTSPYIEIRQVHSIVYITKITVLYTINLKMYKQILFTGENILLSEHTKNDTSVIAS